MGRKKAKLVDRTIVGHMLVCKTNGRVWYLERPTFSRSVEAGILGQVTAMEEEVKLTTW
jgi:hypothetical protein